ncbi:MAG: ABC transporter substrate-binding protein [Streptosporangiales bacterium]|nr:ABC transporter substrate-binding protein [Streptosporangiales bacterium]
MRTISTRLVAAVAAAALTAAMATGCTGKPAGSPVDEGDTGGKQRTFTYDTYSQVVTEWDPAISYSNEIIAMSNVYETLTRYDAETEKVEPLLATEWDSSNGGRTWTFTLRDDVTFHSGRKLTAEAAKGAIDRTRKLGKGAAYIWDAVKEVQAPESDRLVLELKYPAPMDLISSADYAAYIYDTEAAGDADLQKWFNKGNDAGTGPYTAGDWEQGEEIELTLDKYGKYWGGWSGNRYSRVVYRVVPQDTTAAQLARSGEVSFVQQMSPHLWKTFKDDKSVTRPARNSWQNLFALFNTESGPLADKRARQGMAHAIDYEGILAALKGAGTRTPGVVPDGLLGHDPRLPQYERDTAKAKQLLNAAGYGPGKKQLKLSLTYTEGDSNEQLAASLIKSNLAKLNVKLTTRGLQWPTQWAKAKSSDLKNRQDILLFYWWPDYASPYSWFINLFHTEQPPSRSTCSATVCATHSTRGG